MLAQFLPDYSAGSATSGYGVAVVGTDSTTTGNTDNNLYTSLALTGNAAKTGFASYHTITSSSTTADTLYSGYFTGTASGAISTGSRSMFGVSSAPFTNGANSGGTTNLYGGSFSPQSTGSTTGSTVNVYGVNVSNTATLTTGGTINSYGVYVNNGSMNTTGTSTQYGLYVAPQSGADANYAAYLGGTVGIGTSSASAPVQLNGIQLSYSETSNQKWGFISSESGTYINGNAYYDGSWRYMASSLGSSMVNASPASGVLFYTTATTGTAGNTISNWTEKMRLSLAGNLDIGGGTDASTKLEVEGGYFGTTYNTGGTYPTYDGQYFANAWNFTNAGGEVDFWNSQSSGTRRGFVFRQQTASSTQTALMYIEGGGNVGIGMTPTYKLDVSGDIRTSGTFRGTCNVDPNFSDFDCADYAETYDASEPTTVGDVLVSDANKKVKRSTQGYQPNILGVSSTNPGALLDGTNFLAGNTAAGNNNPLKPAVALNGRVPVKVTNENGPVHAGDFVTSSVTQPGFAMKATRSGQVVGQAINEPSTDSNGRTTVVIFIKPGYQIINNSFVLGEEDVQLAGQPNGGITNAPDTGFIINQKGSGNIIQLQQGGVDKLLMANDGSLHISTTIATGTVLEVKNNDTSLLSIDYVGTARFGGTLIVKKDVAVLGRVLGSTAVVGKNTSNQDIHQGDLLMLTGATDVPTLGDNPTVTVSPAVAGSNVVLVGIADRNLSDFNLDPEAPAPTDPTIIKPGEFVSIVITGTYKKVGLVGSISVGDKLTASGTADKDAECAKFSVHLIAPKLIIYPSKVKEPIYTLYHIIDICVKYYGAFLNIKKAGHP
jgi:hypothetical protein